MPLKLNTPTFSFKTSRCLLYRGLLLLLTFSLLDGTLTAQSEQETKQADADRLLNEAVQIYKEGSKNSLEKALQKLQRARPVFQSADDAWREAVTLSYIGRIFDELGKKQQALNHYRQALLLYQRIRDRDSEIATLESIGRIYDFLNEKQKAFTYYNQGSAMQLFDEGLKLYRGKTQESHNAAIEKLTSALLLYQSTKDNVSEAKTLNLLSSLHNYVGERQRALDYLKRALSLYRDLNDSSGEAVMLTHMGFIYNSVGERLRALEYYTQALLIYRKTHDTSQESMTLNHMGRVYLELGERKKALDSYTQALQLVQSDKFNRRHRGNRASEAAALNNIGEFYDSMNEKHKAFDYYSQALPLQREYDDGYGAATTLNNIGKYYDYLGEKRKAFDHYSQALLLFRSIGIPYGEVITLYNMARLAWDRGDLIEARRQIEAALVIIENLRHKITNQELRASYFATVQDYYKLYIDLLMRLHQQRPTDGYDGEALQISERARARILLETLAEANADIRQGVDPKLIQRERKLQQQLNEKAQEQMKLLSNPHTEEQAEVIASDLEALATEVQQVETQIRQTSQRYAALMQPQPLALEAIQNDALDRDTLLLEYSLGTERSYLWAVTTD